MSASIPGPKRDDLDDFIVEEILNRTSGRSRCVVEQILEHGFVTTAKLAELGYEHPPRAAADVRDKGIPLLTITKSIEGKKVAHYVFPDPFETLDESASGRTAISKGFRKDVIDHYGAKDIFTGTSMSTSDLQIDHRIPFRISGDPKRPFDVTDFMPVSAAMNRAKSWACEACPNWEERSQSTCKICYWAIPDQQYEHVATISVRRLDLVWQAEEVQEFDRLLGHSQDVGSSAVAEAKRLIAESLARLHR